MTQLGSQQGRTVGTYRQSRLWGEDGQPVKTTDWTDHGRPQNHTNPHDQYYLPNPTGGTPQNGPNVPFTPLETGSEDQ